MHGSSTTGSLPIKGMLSRGFIRIFRFFPVKEIDDFTLFGERNNRLAIELDDTLSLNNIPNVTIDPFLYTILMTIHPQRKPEEALSTLDDEIKRIQDDLVNEDEVARAIKQARAIFAYGSENITNQAFWMGYSEMFADYSWFLNYLDKLAAVTPAEVQRVAQEYLQPKSRVVGTYIPDGGEA